MILQLNRLSGCLFRKCKLVLIAVILIGLFGCNISNDDGLPVQDEVAAELYANEMIFADVTLKDTCPVVTGRDLADLVAPMGHTRVFNVQLQKAESLLLPAVQRVIGHFQIKLCETLTDNFQFEWNLRINNKEGFEFTGWSLVDPDAEEELLSVQFSNKTESGPQVQDSGVLELDGEFVVAPMGLVIIISTTDPEDYLVGSLLPKVQEGK